MSFFKRTLPLLPVLFSSAVWATTYTYNITGYTTSVTITGAIHGIGSKYIGVQVWTGTNATGTPVTSEQYNPSINASTFDVTVTINPGRSTGSIKLSGPYSALTAAATDFQLTTGNSGLGVQDQLIVCSSCTPSAYAARSDGAGRTYMMSHPRTLTAGAAGQTTFTVRAYLLGGVTTFGINVSSGGSVSAACDGSCTIEWNVASFPSNSVALGHAMWSAQGMQFGAVTDDRPFSFQ